jgi:hypothetical protein
VPPLTEQQVLAWADAHHARTGQWPTWCSGPVAGAPQENWMAVDAALRAGKRSLPGGSSVARLLAQQRGKRNHMGLPSLTREQVLAWADAHHGRTGRWPTRDSGPIAEAPGETWDAVNTALQRGGRGLPGRSSLTLLLAQRRGYRHQRLLPRLSDRQILHWADAFHRRTGGWPTVRSGAIPDSHGETWRGVHSALYQGLRGLPGGSSLARLLEQARGARNEQNLCPLTIPGILAWADAHYRRTGQWPKRESGAIVDAPGESWTAVHEALSQGRRRLPGGTSLPRLLAEQRGVRNHLALPRLTPKQIRGWATAHHRRTGKWPTQRSGAVVDAPGETWAAIERALWGGGRGLPGGSSLARLLKRVRR